MISKYSKKGYDILVSPQFIRFFVSGITAFAFDFGLLTFMVYVLKFDAFVLGVISVPNVISTLVGLSVTFALNRYWTFGIKSRAGVRSHGTKFILTAAVVWVIHNLSFGLLVQLGMVHVLAKFIVMAVQMVVNFFLYKYVVFK